MRPNLISSASHTLRNIPFEHSLELMNIMLSTGVVGYAWSSHGRPPNPQRVPFRQGSFRSCNWRVRGLDVSLRGFVSCFLSPPLCCEQVPPVKLLVSCGPFIGHANTGGHPSSLSLLVDITCMEIYVHQPLERCSPSKNIAILVGHLLISNNMLFLLLLLLFYQGYWLQLEQLTK